MNSYNTFDNKRNVGAGRRVAYRRSRVSYFAVLLSLVSEFVHTTAFRCAAAGLGLLAFFGLIGGMECGSIPMFVGLPLCGLLFALGLFTKNEGF